MFWTLVFPSVYEMSELHFVNTTKSLSHYKVQGGKLSTVKRLRQPPVGFRWREKEFAEVGRNDHRYVEASQSDVFIKSDVLSVKNNIGQTAEFGHPKCLQEVKPNSKLEYFAKFIKVLWADLQVLILMHLTGTGAECTVLSSANGKTKEETVKAVTLEDDEVLENITYNLDVNRVPGDLYRSVVMFWTNPKTKVSRGRLLKFEPSSKSFKQGVVREADGSIWANSGGHLMFTGKTVYMVCRKDNEQKFCCFNVEQMSLISNTEKRLPNSRLHGIVRVNHKEAMFFMAGIEGNKTVITFLECEKVKSRHTMKEAMKMELNGLLPEEPLKWFRLVTKQY